MRRTPLWGGNEFANQESFDDHLGAKVRCTSPAELLKDGWRLDRFGSLVERLQAAPRPPLVLGLPGLGEAADGGGGQAGVGAEEGLKGRSEVGGGHLDDRGLLDHKGHPRPATKLLTEAHAALLRHLEALGLTPGSAAKLGVSLSQMQGLTLAARIAAERNKP